MKQALEALESLDSGDSYKTHNAATALRQAIEQAEKRDPVAWVLLENWKSGKFWANDCFAETSESPEMSPLYTAPPPQKEWVGLTDEEIDYFAGFKPCHSLARVIEAKLREKNT